MLKEIRWEVNQSVDVRYTTGMTTATFSAKGDNGELAAVSLDEKALVELRTAIQEVLTLFPVDP